ncbi:MAG: adenine phosphoribosyltransferase [Actinomycetota bacterium]|nr:adenine phosphoribosyltransferase [Actinomycetota bacterium]
MTGTDAGWLADRIRDVPDFPKPGVVYKDITPLLADPKGLEHCVAALAEPFAARRVDKVVGIEARGFILAAPVAMRLGAGFVPVRKAGKLPWKVRSDTYDLEYGTDTLEIHRDALSAGERVLVVDDVLATGGTASAGVRLVKALGATTVGFGCVIELAFLAGRAKLEGVEAVSLITYT